MYFLEDPEPQADKIPDGKEKGGNKLPDIWRDAEVMAQTGDNAQIDEVAQSHEKHEPDNFTARLALAGLVIKHPLFIDDEKEDVSTNTCDCQRRRLVPMR